MALMAVCVRCGVENSPMNTACDVCKAPLGTALTAATTVGESGPWVWTAVSAGITATLGLLAWMFHMQPLTLAVAMFYGPLIASYRARDNVVGHAALGGMAGMFALLLLSMPLSWDDTRAILAGAIGAKPTASAVVLFFVGVVVLFATILPLSLVGASVGELLAVRRRRRPVTAATVDAAPVKLSDAELAKVEL